MAPKKRSHELSLAPGRASGAQSPSPSAPDEVGRDSGFFLRMGCRPRPSVSSEASCGGEPARIAIIGKNLKHLRAQRQVTLHQLASQTTSDTTQLAALEAGTFTPTIELLWQLASALGVRFSALVQAAPTTHAAPTQSTALVRRSLLPATPVTRRGTEVHELRLPAHAEERATRAPSGMFETLLVTAGSVLVQLDTQTHLLEPGDSLAFPVDADRIYVNPGDRDAVMFAMIAPSPRA